MWYQKVYLEYHPEINVKDFNTFYPDQKVGFEYGEDGPLGVIYLPYWAPKVAPNETCCDFPPTTPYVTYKIIFPSPK